MWSLVELSPELLLPGVDLFPNNAVRVVETNPAFVAAFLAGANHEMTRELLWREYPADIGVDHVPPLLGPPLTQRSRHRADGRLDSSQRARRPRRSRRRHGRRADPRRPRAPLPDGSSAARRPGDERRLAADVRRLDSARRPLHGLRRGERRRRDARRERVARRPRGAADRAAVRPRHDRRRRGRVRRSPRGTTSAGSTSTSHGDRRPPRHRGRVAGRHDDRRERRGGGTPRTWRKPRTRRRSA